ncbi:unnamed protein product [Moneuplotes crassus]|uniref:Uncharacterized protein n=1 Tax=Euplotes crassus TaxID=5936 RepID=A0AAD1UQX4_EUPCR|nr:unnamed protein product [Moneuplotes crassus]
MNKEDALSHIDIAYQKINNQNNGYGFDSRKNKVDLELKSCPKSRGLYQSSSQIYLHTPKNYSDFTTPKKAFSRKEIHFSRGSSTKMISVASPGTTNPSTESKHLNKTRDKPDHYKKSIETLSSRLFTREFNGKSSDYKQPIISNGLGFYSKSSSSPSLIKENTVRRRNYHQKPFTRTGSYARSGSIAGSYMPVFTNQVNQYYRRY